MASKEELLVTGHERSGRNLLVDPDRQYTEDEKRAAILWQSAYRASSTRKDYHKLQYQGLSSDAVEFQRAVKSSNRVLTGVTAASADVQPALAAPIGVLLSAYRLHMAYKHKALQNFWGLWKCFITNVIIDLPLGILAHFFLLCFTGAVFYAPMWASITVRFIFYDGEGQIDIDQFIRWLLVFTLCTCALWSVACVFFVLLQSRFSNRVKSQITVVSSQFGKLVTKADVDRFRTADLAATRRIFFSYAPRGLAAFLVSIAGLNFLFIRSTYIGLLTIGIIVLSSLTLAVYDHMVGVHSNAVDEAKAVECEFWAYMMSRDKQIAAHEILALGSETQALALNQSTYHISMGGLFKFILTASVVGMVAIGAYQITSSDIRQYELLFSFFYYLFTMSCVFWLNSSTVGILQDLGGAFRLATFLNSTRHCVRDWQVEMAKQAKDDGNTSKDGVKRFTVRTGKPPFIIIFCTTTLIGGAVAAFVSVAITAKTSIGCQPAEMVCNMCGHATHILKVPQHFDMEDGCKFELSPEDMAENCKRTEPVDTDGSRARSRRKLEASGIKCEVHVTAKTDRLDEVGYNVPQPEENMPVKYSCEQTCPPPEICHAAGTCTAEAGCTYPILPDTTQCETGGIMGTCRSGECIVDSLSGQAKRRLEEKTKELEWHQARRLRQLSSMSNTQLNLTPFEQSAFEGIRSNKQQIAEQWATTHRRLAAKSAESPQQPSPSKTQCPLPGNENDDESLCPASVVRGCMDDTALNYRPDATLNTQCCYPPNRYVKVEMTESIFMENYWTIHVQDETNGMQVVGTGLPLLGSDEVCVPEETCVKVTTFDEGCDGFTTGGGGVEVASRVMVDGKMQTFIDNDGNFHCSKKTQFGTCGMEGCTDKTAVNYNHDASIEDGSCEYLSCRTDEQAVVVNIKYDEDPQQTSWKLTDESGITLVDSRDFDHIYAGPTSMHYYCFPSTKCVYFLAKDSNGDGLSSSGHYEVKYGDVGALDIVASGHEFEWIKAHFVGGKDAQCAAPAQLA